MRVVVIGAGLAGVATAHELAMDGHAVTVLERRASVAEEASFAQGGLLTPWAVPGPPAQTDGASWPGGSGLSRAWDRHQMGWLWRARRARQPAAQARQAEHLQALARLSRDQFETIDRRLNLAYDRQTGPLVLLRGERELERLREGLKRMAELGVPFKLLDAARVRALEPALSSEAPLHAAVQLTDGAVGNARQFIQSLRADAQGLGVRFRFHRQVDRIQPGTAPAVHHSPSAAGPGGESEVEACDAVVVCAAMGSADLLHPLGVKLPLLPVHGYSVSAPLRQVEGHHDLGPNSAVVDVQTGVIITRLGARIRASGLAEVGGRVDQIREPAIATLFEVLNHWFPGALVSTQPAQVQRWKGVRPTLPDGLPAIGATGAEGIWLNSGHGDHGWSLSTGSARLLADALGGRASAIDTEGFSPLRWATARARRRSGSH